MTIDTNQFWELLAESKIVEASRVDHFRQQFEDVVSSQDDLQPNGKMAAKWLLKKNAITAYQAQILLAGHAGPFLYGNYVVTQKPTQGVNNHLFSGKHFSTSYPVNMEFVPADQTSDLKKWSLIERRVEVLKSIRHTNLVPILETVKTPDYRFVVTNVPKGKLLAELVPRKSRLPIKEACGILAHVANGLIQLHEQARFHGAVSPLNIYCQKAGRAQLGFHFAPELAFDHIRGEKSEVAIDYLSPEGRPKTSLNAPAADIYALGCVLCRVISGRPVFPGPTKQEKLEQHLNDSPPDLTRYKATEDVQSLVNAMLAKSPADRPTATQVAKRLCEIAGQPDLLMAESNEEPKPVAAFRKAIAQPRLEELRLGDEKPFATVASIGTLTTVEDVEAENRPRKSAEELAASIASKRTQSKWKAPAIIAGCLLGLSAVIGVLAFRANQTELVIDLKPQTAAETEKDMDADPEQDMDQPQVADLQNVRLVQNIIEVDDNQSLWETPTLGEPIDLSYHPPAPRIILTLRPQELFAHEEGSRLLRSLGPSLQSRIDSWLVESGLAWSEMAELVVTLHNGEQEYEAFFSFRPSEEVNLEAIKSKFGELSESSIGDATLYSANGRSYYFDTDPDSGNVLRCVFGKPETVREVLESQGINTLTGTIKSLVEYSDRDRHFNFIFLRPALFNQYGQALMSGQLDDFNRKLDLFLQDEIRGARISVHLDEGNYLELALDQTVDLDPRELKISFESRLRTLRDSITQHLATIPSNSYWDKVRLRYDNMLADVYRNLRWDVEYGQLIGNSWLPPMAMHNLLAGTELVTAFSSGTDSMAQVATKKVPQSLEELLTMKRGLNVTTNPDLNVLLTGIRNEIVDEYGSLPFEFEIRLVGNDLQKEGITQNQRPGDFKMNDRSLAEILTEIMVRCNPDKNITGPADPGCKLVWAIGPDPNRPETTAILITTREGISNRNLTLPESFKSD